MGDATQMGSSAMTACISLKWPRFNGRQQRPKEVVPELYSNEFLAYFNKSNRLITGSTVGHPIEYFDSTRGRGDGERGRGERGRP